MRRTMAEYHDREHFLPIRKADLIELLCRTKPVGGAAVLSAPEQDQFRRLCTILGAYYHHKYRARLEALKDAYTPFDPDRDTKVLTALTDEQRAGQLDS